MERHRHGGDVYSHPGCLDFSANCNPLGTPPSVIQAAAVSLEEIRNYPDSSCRALREALAAYEGVKPDQVICTNGAAELIFALCQALRPRRALLTAPTFAEYAQALRAVGAGCELRYHRLLEERGFDLEEDYLDALEPDVDIAFLCSPNNPNGRLIPRELLLQIVERCGEQGIRLILDECFLDFVPREEAASLSGRLEDFPHLLILKAFTKRYCMAGLRLGYGLCADERLLEKIGAVTQPWRVSIPAQAAGLAALKERDHVEAGRELSGRERVWLERELTALGLPPYPSQANFLLFRGPENLSEKLLEQGFLIRDCSNYEGLGPGYYRIAVRLHEENVRLVKALGKAVS